MLTVSSKLPITKTNIVTAYNKAMSISHNSATMVEHLKKFLPRLEVTSNQMHVTISTKRTNKNLATILLV